MKKSILLVAISMFAICLNAQIKSFTIDASKTYDSGNRVAYLSFSDVVDLELIPIIEGELTSHPGIIKFSFFDKSDTRKVMFECNSEITEDIVVEMINDIILSNSTDKTLKSDFLKFEDFGSSKIVYFKVVGFTDVKDEKEFILDLEHSKYVISVERFDDGLYKVKAEKDLTPENINSLLEKYEAIINKNFLSL